jgi:hypothetical protein
MLKKIYFLADFKKLHCRTSLDGPGPEKLGRQVGRAEIFKPESMGRAEQICDSDERTGPQN